MLTLRGSFHSWKGWPGAEQARRVIDFSNGLAESALESCARVVFHEAGLPQPELQVILGIGNGRSVRVDFPWSDSVRRSPLQRPGEHNI